MNLFDHLVGAAEQRQRHGEAERLCSKWGRWPTRLSPPTEPAGQSVSRHCHYPVSFTTRAPWPGWCALSGQRMWGLQCSAGFPGL